MAAKPPMIAVIGSGYWGKNLIRNYSELGALKLICDQNENTLNAFKEQFAGLETCLAANDVYGDTAIEGVVIATPGGNAFYLGS